MIHYLLRLFDKLGAILSTAAGWAAAAAIMVCNYFSGHAAIIWLVIGVTVVDALFGIRVSLKRGKFTLSGLARLTIDKLTVYGLAMAIFVGIDKVLHTDITASVVGTCIVLVEAWSTSASMLIIYPHMAVLSILRHALTGEIASKLGISEDKVEEALKKTTRKKAEKVTREQVEEARKIAKHTKRKKQ